MGYYIKMVYILWKLPLKLRIEDIENLALKVQRMRITDQELNEYVNHLRTYIKDEY